MATELVFGRGSMGGAGPAIPFATKTSTPLDDGTAHGDFPTPLLWAMKEHRRIHLDLHHDPHAERLGVGDSTVWVIDTEHGHCTIGRLVGKAPDGTVYCLVGTIKGETYAGRVADPSSVVSIFSEAHHLVLCGVYESGVSNVMDIRLYKNADEVPAEFMPPHPFADFPDSIEPETF
jgi:hypothetical protein